MCSNTTRIQIHYAAVTCLSLGAIINRIDCDSIFLTYHKSLKDNVLSILKKEDYKIEYENIFHLISNKTKCYTFTNDIIRVTKSPGIQISLHCRFNPLSVLTIKSGQVLYRIPKELFCNSSNNFIMSSTSFGHSNN